MALTAVSNNSPISPPARGPEARNTIDNPLEKSVAPPPPAPLPVPTLNTDGQTLGTRINTSA